LDNDIEGHFKKRIMSSTEAKKDEFRRYLERTGVIDALTRVLIGLYEEPAVPNALDYVKQHLGGPTVNVDVEGLKRENEELKRQLAALQQKQLDIGEPPRRK
jgi:hypothetical protein